MNAELLDIVTMFDITMKRRVLAAKFSLNRLSRRTKSRLNNR